jgi:hypothetical protein
MMTQAEPLGSPAAHTGISDATLAHALGNVSSPLHHPTIDDRSLITSRR